MLDRYCGANCGPRNAFHFTPSTPLTPFTCSPGGWGTRKEVLNPVLLDALRRLAQVCDRVLSVCTGAALLSAAGLLDGR